MKRSTVILWATFIILPTLNASSLHPKRYRQSCCEKYWKIYVGLLCGFATCVLPPRILRHQETSFSTANFQTPNMPTRSLSYIASNGSVPHFCPIHPSIHEDITKQKNPKLYPFVLTILCIKILL